MKTVKSIFGIIIVSIILSSCYTRTTWGVKGKGENINEKRGLSGFNKISLSVDADVYYTQDSVYSVEVIGQSNILKVLRIEVADKKLKIEYMRHVWDHHKVKIYVHSPNMVGMYISGSGDIKSETTIKTIEMETNISGSGNIFIPSLKADELSCKISGSGNISVDAGEVRNEKFSISGSGNINTEYLYSKSNKSTISGSGDIFTNVSEDLDVTISGSGDVRYRGRPTVNVKTSGSGRLIHID